MKENEEKEETPSLESGLQFLQRLIAKNRGSKNFLKFSALEGLGDLLSGQVLQIVQQQYCQSGLLHQLLAEGMIQTEVILVITDGHFDLPTFSRYFKKKYSSTNSTEQVEKLLSRLHLFHVFDSEHFELTCSEFGSFLREHLDLRLIIVDTLTAFYWSDVVDAPNPVKMDSYLRKVLRMVQLAVREYHLGIIYTRPDYFISKSGISTIDQCMESVTLERINYNIVMKEKDDRNSTSEMFTISASSSKSTLFKNYCFDNEDIHWFS